MRLQIFESRGVGTYAIGDVQGCFDSFKALIEQVELDEEDRLWLVGDLVNRGPKSLATLRWVKDHEDQCVAVLGNHDLHLLAMAAGLRKPKVRDTAQEVLEADDADELIDWLRRRPLLVREDARLLVHAGLHPTWSTDEAVERAREVEAVLTSDGWRDGMSSLYGQSDGTDPEEARLRETTSVLTRIRCVYDADGEWALDHDFDGAPAEAPDELRPWYQVDCKRNELVVFGHWAALGLHRGRGHLALDTGCVWGGKLTAVCLENSDLFQQKAVD